MEPQRSPAAADESAVDGRTSFVLSASQIEFLERFCARLRRESGVRFTKASVLRVLVAILRESQIPFAEIRTETHLEEWLRSAARGGARPAGEAVPAISR